MQSGQDSYSSAGFPGVVVQEDQLTGLSLGSVAGIVVGMIVLVLLILVPVVIVAVFM